MTEQITLLLPSGVLRSAEILAQRAGQPVGELLAQTIELSLRPLGNPPLEEKDLAKWSDAEVIEAAEKQMATTEDERLSELLDRQQAGTITDPERAELSALMDLYQRQLLLKAQALKEAIRRGLRKPLEP